LLAFGAVVLAATISRDDSRVTMFGGHDRRTFRGKLHNASFGKYRMRKNKARRVRKIKNGTYDKSAVVQVGQPEPEHCWDIVNISQNPMHPWPQYFRDVWEAHYEEYVEMKRKNWKGFMGVQGKQWAYKDWTPPEEEQPAEVAAACLVGAKISAKDVKELRERSRAGILDCKKALGESDGDMEKAMDWLKKRGIAKADKKSGNIAAEGNVASYVHFNSKIAVIVEINSETDFVASNAIFKEFTSDVAMQIAANPDVVCITTDDVPADIKQKEKETEMGKDDLQGKPENIKGKLWKAV